MKVKNKKSTLLPAVEIFFCLQIVTNWVLVMLSNWSKVYNDEIVVVVAVVVFVLLSPIKR